MTHDNKGDNLIPQVIRIDRNGILPAICRFVGYHLGIDRLYEMGREDYRLPASLTRMAKDLSAWFKDQSRPTG